MEEECNQWSHCSRWKSKGKRNRLDQLDRPRDIFIDEDESVYVWNNGNHRVMKWVMGAKEGIVVAGGHCDGNRLRQLSYPHRILVDQSDGIYVADVGNHRVMRWLNRAEEGMIVVGGNGQGEQSNQLKPIYFSFDRENNLYVIDKDNHRVQRFDMDKNQNF